MGSLAGKSKRQGKIKDYVAWFEIPAMNFNQALAFYNQIYGLDMEVTVADDHTMAFFPADGGIGGAIVYGPGSIPHENGPLIYLNGGDDLNHVLQRVEPAGGRVIMPKTSIAGGGGYFAIFIDSEGNKLALHSKN
jgi:predicted enzyme related to lactoylglutathione lyase